MLKKYTDKPHPRVKSWIIKNQENKRIQGTYTKSEGITKAKELSSKYNRTYHVIYAGVFFKFMPKLVQQITIQNGKVQSVWTVKNKYYIPNAEIKFRMTFKSNQKPAIRPNNMKPKYTTKKTQKEIQEKKQAFIQEKKKSITKRTPQKRKLRTKRNKELAKNRKHNNNINRNVAQNIEQT